MEKKCKKNKRGIADIVALIALAVVITLSGFTIVKAEMAKSKVAEATDMLNACNKGDTACYALADKAISEAINSVEENLGAIPGGDIYIPVTFYSNTNYGEGRNTQKIFHKIISFTTATVTPVVWRSKTDGYKDFYLIDMWLEVTGKSTSTKQLCVATGTVTSIAYDNATFLKEEAGCTLMKGLGNAFGADGATYTSLTATSSQFNMFVYPGTNNTIAANKVPETIASTTYILVYATDTPMSVATSGASSFGGKLHIYGREKN